MDLATSIALFTSMVVLALIPGPGILAVVARTLSAGMRHGVSTTVGIVAGDFVFITFALLGLAALSSAMGEFFLLVKYAGALYLVWMGVSLIRGGSQKLDVEAVKAHSHIASFMAGLITTLGNPKAILFYLSFFPAFLELHSLTGLDTIVIFLVTTLAVGGVMLAYAWVAHASKGRFQRIKTSSLPRYASGALMVGSGVYLAARSS